MQRILGSSALKTLVGTVVKASLMSVFREKKITIQSPVCSQIFEFKIAAYLDDLRKTYDRWLH